ncbi:MAG: HAD family hydrolase [Fimbriimonas sp.]
MGQIRLVCFDLGGVLVRIGQTWGEMATAAGIPSPLSPDIRRGDFPPFVRYEEGAITFEAYIVALAGLMECTSEDAARIHAHMLIEPYPGTLELVRDIRSAGLATGCLSNTNAPHWAELVSDRFPAIQQLDHRLASFQVRLAKPDPAIFRKYQEQFGFAPEEILFFDDAVANVRAAESCGWIARSIDLRGDTSAQIRAELAALGVHL